MTKQKRERQVIENGTVVRMKRQHPHAGKRGFVRAQPSESGGVAGMYLIEFDGAYEGNAYAYPEDFTVTRQPTRPRSEGGK